MAKIKKSSVIAAAGPAGLNAVRYAAYSLSGSAYVFLKPLAGGKVLAEFEPKPGVDARAAAALPARFRQELEDEKFREKNSAENSSLREFLLLKAVNYAPKAPEPEPDSGLTPKQEKELNDLIHQIEKEIKAETAGGKKDPLGITRTWEDKYGSKTGNKKKR